MKSKIDRSLLAEETGLELAEVLDGFEFVADRIKILPYAYVKKKGVLPLKEEEGILYVAVHDPYDLEMAREVQCITGSKVREILSSREAIDAAIEVCYGQGESASSIIYELDEGEARDVVPEAYDLLDHDSDSAVIKILNAVLVEALQQSASDIHLEPVERGLQVRYRIDGILQVRHVLSKEVQAPLITRIKVLSKLDIAEQRLPQDGRIKLTMGGRDIDFRVSTVPVVFGERVVLRILDHSGLLLRLDELGMRGEVLVQVRAQMQKTQGILLVTGPTGSGKTTTLYGILSEIRSSAINVMTIEDPVEFKLEGMAQIGVNPKIALDFARGLRHILRQDPDVIMIGEIRDKETAEIAIQASLTGHLVMSTLHTNDAPSAVARLVDMGIEPYLLTSSLMGVLAQRLVRKVCRECRGSGCSNCYQTGYKGRVGVYEFMPMTGALKQQVLQSADATKLQAIAVEEGMQTLHDMGMSLVHSGITTLEEVLRVARGG